MLPEVAPGLEQLYRSMRRGPHDAGVPLQGVLHVLKVRHALGAETVQQKSAVTGDEATKVFHKSSLDGATAARCFIEACPHTWGGRSEVRTSEPRSPPPTHTF